MTTLNITININTTYRYTTPEFTWFTTNEVAMSTGTPSLLYSVKGLQSSYCALLRNISLFLFSSLLFRASAHKVARALLLSL